MTKLIEWSTYVTSLINYLCTKMHLRWQSFPSQKYSFLVIFAKLCMMKYLIMIYKLDYKTYWCNSIDNHKLISVKFIIWMFEYQNNLLSTK